MDERPFPCGAPDCHRSFTSKRGRGVHEQKAHKNWFDEKYSKANQDVKKRWSAEESGLMAHQEAILLPQNVKCINKALQKILPNRTIEAIKSQRKKPFYKSLVYEKTIELLVEKTKNNLVEAPESCNPDAFLIKENVFAKMKPLDTNTYQAPILDSICKNSHIWTLDHILEDLTLYLREILPECSLKTRNLHNLRSSKPFTKRQLRRQKYVRTQRAWKKNPCKCLKMILDNKTQSDLPDKQSMVSFWKSMMTPNCDTPPDLQKEKDESCKNEIEIWHPITQKEITDNKPKLTTSPGPDGLTARQFRAIPVPILLRIFNLFWLVGKLPEHLLRARTTLIPKKDHARLPED